MLSGMLDHCGDVSSFYTTASNCWARLTAMNQKKWWYGGEIGVGNLHAETGSRYSFHLRGGNWISRSSIIILLDILRGGRSIQSWFHGEAWSVR